MNCHRSVACLATRLIALMLYLLVNRGALSAPAADEVEFESGGVSLSGTLFFPKDEAPFAAAVLVHGSGEVRRMTGLAHLLVSGGIAVLTYDKRGVGKSGGVYEGVDNVSAANLEVLAEDAAAAFATLIDHPDLVGVPAGFIGVSQAGWIAPLAATRSSTASFIALWSGPVCTVSEELHFSALAEGEPDFWKKNSPEEIRQHMKSVRYRPDDVDPRASLSRLSIPGLWLFGAQDNSIPVELSVARLRELIQKGQRHFQYRIFPEYGHNLADSPKQLSYQFLVEWIETTISEGRAAQQTAPRNRTNAGRER